MRICFPPRRSVVGCKSKTENANTREPAGSAAPGLPPSFLNGLRDTPLTHDTLFHSVLGLVGVQAAEYQKTLDAFAACRP